MAIKGATITGVSTTSTTTVISGTTVSNGGSDTLGFWAVDSLGNSYFLGNLNPSNGNDKPYTLTSTVTLPKGTYTIEAFSTTSTSNALPSGTALATDTGVALCFMSGTMIRTPDGEVAIEALKPGDLVVTAEGGVVPVVWLGRRTVATRFSDPIRSHPIRISAGALGDNTPSRDLLVSPDHALLVDGALIHAGALVNGTSVVREVVATQMFTYYHVETDDHSLILADNTPAETFIDNVDRLNFDNWAEHEALHLNGKTIKELPYPRAKSSRQIPVATRVRLAELAIAISAKIPDVA